MEENHFIDTLIINVENKYMVNSLNKSFGGYFHFLFVFPQMSHVIVWSRDIVRSSIDKDKVTVKLKPCICIKYIM